MRWVALAVPLLFLIPHAAAAHSYDIVYYMQGAGCGGGEIAMRNCSTYFPDRKHTGVTVEADDISGASIRIRVCHEWTYDNGSHPTVTCNVGCSPTFSDALTHPPYPWNTTYRVIVDLRNGPGACQVAATAGQISIAFT